MQVAPARPISSLTPHDNQTSKDTSFSGEACISPVRMCTWGSRLIASNPLLGTEPIVKYSAVQNKIVCEQQYAPTCVCV